MTLTVLRALLFTGLLLLPTRVLAFDFSIDANETVILNDDLDTNTGWQLSSQLEISDGVLTHKNTGSYGRATYHFDQPLNLADGAVSLYWAGSFPNDAHRERDAYWASLQFADNAPVCWDIGTNEVLASSGGSCPSGYLRVDEDSELRVWLRPESRAHSTFHRVYVDPGFIPGIDPEGLDYPLTQLRQPNHPETTEQYRLRVEQIGHITEAILSFWDGSDWQALSTRSGSNPLLIDDSDWTDVDGTVYDPIFEALNFQFRGPGPDGVATRVDAIAITQARNTTQSVPEPSLLLGFVALGAFGYRQQHQR
ncbi:MAG: hypothetical protein AAFZ80_00170 [Cyanobacteria bacterium P01_A01_bin.105]